MGNFFTNLYNKFIGEEVVEPKSLAPDQNNVLHVDFYDEAPVEVETPVVKKKVAKKTKPAAIDVNLNPAKPTKKPVSKPSKKATTKKKV